MAAGFESLSGKTPERKWHWNCAGGLCTSNWRSQTPGLEYYSLRGIESNENLKIAYAKVLKNSNINILEENSNLIEALVLWKARKLRGSSRPCLFFWICEKT